MADALVERWTRDTIADMEARLERDSAHPSVATAVGPDPLTLPRARADAIKSNWMRSFIREWFTVAATEEIDGGGRSDTFAGSIYARRLAPFVLARVGAAYEWAFKPLYDEVARTGIWLQAGAVLWRGKNGTDIGTRGTLGTSYFPKCAVLYQQEELHQLVALSPIQAFPVFLWYTGECEIVAMNVKLDGSPGSFDISTRDYRWTMSPCHVGDVLRAALYTAATAGSALPLNEWLLTHSTEWPWRTALSHKTEGLVVAYGRPGFMRSIASPTAVIGSNGDIAMWTHRLRLEITQTGSYRRGGGGLRVKAAALHAAPFAGTKPVHPWVDNTTRAGFWGWWKWLQAAVGHDKFIEWVVDGPSLANAGISPDGVDATVPIKTAVARAVGVTTNATPAHLKVTDDPITVPPPGGDTRDIFRRAGPLTQSKHVIRIPGSAPSSTNDPRVDVSVVATAAGRYTVLVRPDGKPEAAASVDTRVTPPIFTQSTTTWGNYFWDLAVESAPATAYIDWNLAGQLLAEELRYTEPRLHNG